MCQHLAGYCAVRLLNTDYTIYVAYAIKINKQCSEFCVTVGTVTSTASIVIDSRLKVLAVNLSRPSGWLWLYVALIGYNNPHWLETDIVVCANPSSSTSLWVVSVGEYFFWYRLTRVVPDRTPLNGCVCVCVCISIKRLLCMYVYVAFSFSLTKQFLGLWGEDCTPFWVLLICSCCVASKLSLSFPLLLGVKTVICSYVQCADSLVHRR